MPDRDRRFQFGYCNGLAARLDLDTGQVWYWQRPAGAKNGGNFWLPQDEHMWQHFKHFPIPELQHERQKYHRMY
jgi:hypothetical protein